MNIIIVNKNLKVQSLFFHFQTAGKNQWSNTENKKEIYGTAFNVTKTCTEIWRYWMFFKYIYHSV